MYHRQQQKKPNKPDHHSVVTTGSNLQTSPSDIPSLNHVVRKISGLIDNNLIPNFEKLQPNVDGSVREDDLGQGNTSLIIQGRPQCDLHFCLIFFRLVTQLSRSCRPAIRRWKNCWSNRTWPPDWQIRHFRRRWDPCSLWSFQTNCWRRCSFFRDWALWTSRLHLVRHPWRDLLGGKTEQWISNSYLYQAYRIKSCPNLWTNAEFEEMQGWMVQFCLIETVV